MKASLLKSYYIFVLTEKKHDVIGTLFLNQKASK